MKNYEMLAVLPGTLTETEVTPLVASLKELVAKFGGAEIEAHDMGKSRLAYPLNHIRYGYFSLIRFQAPAEKMGEMKTRIDLSGLTLRTIITAYDKATATDPSKLNLTPIANVVGGPDGETPTRDMTRRDAVAPAVPGRKTAASEEASVVTETPVVVTDIEEKLDQILEKDLDKV